MKYLLFVSLFLLAPWVHADYSQHPKTQELLRVLQADYGFAPSDLAAVKGALTQARRVDKLIQRERTAPERTWTWYDYRPIHVNDANIKRGVAFLNEHAETFARAERIYGVPAHFIAAILGAETKYGGYTGPHRVLDSLATQGFDHPTRSKFFFGELAAFFALCRDKGLDPLEPKGSYAGAMGLSQFMPSNYRTLAVDFDDDGEVNLWTPADAIGSAGNYLVNYRGPNRGWRRGEPVTLPLAKPMRPPEGLKTNTRTAPYTLAELARHGLVPVPPQPLDTPAGLIDLEIAKDTPRTWIALRNFYVLMSYNPRTFYAMAVHDLGVALAQATGAPVEGRTDP